MVEKPLTHQEIWDDSYLQQSWDDALEEYKKYHSIAATGEDLDKLIAESKALEEAEWNATGDQAADGSYDEAEEGILPEEAAETHVESRATLQSQTNGTAAIKQEPTSTPQTNSVGMPQAILGTVQDESMRNLMMSWYYAGYYTGLHEGQQQVLARQENN